MKVASIDRGAVLGVAGRGHLSPAVRDGAPVLVAEGESAGRVGWAAFFEAADRAGLALTWDTEDPSAATLEPLGQAAPHVQRAGISAGIDSARRFLQAFRGAPPASPGA